jgi:manganese transport protein
VLPSATFHRNGRIVTEIQQAHRLLAPLLGTSLASLALRDRAALRGQSSTDHRHPRRQVVMEGVPALSACALAARIITRSVAIVPAVIVVAIYGDEGTYKLLILSQVILSLHYRSP